MPSRRDGLSFNRKRRKKINFDIVLEIIGWIFPIGAAILIAAVFVNFFAVRSNMIGSAMEPTIKNGDQILINHFCYLLGKPEAGDIVVFLPNGNEKSHYYVRRVVAGPGDEVQIKDGLLYVNGNLYEEKIDVSRMEDAGICEDPMTLSEDEYFVLGDNRNNSEDSRYVNIGNVKKKYIIGKVWFRFSSWKDIGIVN